MGNWKELGEVPDSDDEALDIQGPHNDNQSGGSKTAAVLKSDGFIELADDVWSVPLSPREDDLQKPIPSPSGRLTKSDQRSRTSTQFLPPASEQTQPIPDVEDEIDLVGGGFQEPSGLNIDTPCPSTPPSANGRRDTEQDVQQPEQKQPSAPSALAEQLTSSPLSSLSSFSLSPSPPSEARPTEPSRDASPTVLPSLPESPSEFRLGFVRSLRPRKPIQQHPYLLENAQYTRFMKSHGVKPVRVAYSSPQNDATAENDSQEQEFVNEESEIPRKDEQSSILREDSQLDLPHSSLDNDGDLERSPASPTSTPPQQLLLSSNRGSGEDGTDDTSMADEDEFPSPRTFMLRRRQRMYGKVSKYRSSPMSSRVNQNKAAEEVLHEVLPSSKWIPVRIDLSPMSSPSHSRVQNPESCPSPVVETVPPAPSPSVPPSANFVVDADHNDEDDAVDFRYTKSPDTVAPLSMEDNDSQSDSDVIRRNGRRIKGVLPASWLRLDQRSTQNGIARTTTTASRRTSHQVDQESRRGVALPKQHTAGSLPAPVFIYDESDGDDDNDVENVRARPRTRVEPWPEDIPDEDEPEEDTTHQRIHDDDTESVIEEDIIDRMTSGTKRKTASKAGLWPKRQKTQISNPFKGIPGQKTRQPKITKMLGRTQESASSSKSHRHIQRSRSSISRRQRRQLSRSSHSHSSPLPPLLSILDVVEPMAPNFIRIAARTARSRPKLGKTSPSQKIINLGNRSDNVDALSVLYDWRAGRIHPREEATTKSARRVNIRLRQSLEELSPNVTRNAARKTRESADTNPPYHTSFRQIQIQPVSNNSEQAKPRVHPRTIKLKIGGSRTPEAAFRPAQLETLARDRPGNAGFVAKKRALDDMYRKRRKEEPLLPNIRLERFIDSDIPAASTPATDDGFEYLDRNMEPGFEPRPEREFSIQDNSRRRSRFRKQYNPKRVDTTALRFVRALDPIPMELGVASQEQQGNIIEPEAEKLCGLGPFGSRYPQHFDVFPLDSGVFFHQSTAIGSGYLSLTIGSIGTEAPRRVPAVTSSFQLDERNLVWRVWDDNTSSEFGILLDWLADLLVPDSPHKAHARPKITNAFCFIIDFAQSIIASPDTQAEVQKSFVLRSLEAISSFADRVETICLQNKVQGVDTSSKNSLATFSGILLVVVLVLRICRNSFPCLAESFQVEDLLKRIAKLSIEALLKCGLDGVREAYEDLQQPMVRERGIGNDKQLLASWVIAIQVLEYARLPRAGFWDVTYSVMLSGISMKTCTDAGCMERLWEDMFTLLPLGEFDSSGIIQPGMRQLVPLDGWALPRQTLSRVFQLYKANSRQSPSFNAYCRAIVGRCHYLVQEWGWRRCSGIIGVIFDFYGSQDFAHLRNEEAYGSPRFLEQLASRPSLAIEPEDKCFHIFIKMLGLVMLQLRRLGLTNELRNLIARTLPNHNRQYLKEMDIHQRDLAALRNHHDLLCTLFWAVPPELRPAVHLIEKLVVPASSHKEACLISIRAWNQLARFVVASGEDYSVYRGFLLWMNSSFQQILDQFLSAESDIQKQFLNLSQTMMQGISPHILKAMATKNKAAAMDVLHACLLSSLDVLRHAPSLDVATYCLNAFQLEQIFTKIEFSAPESNWGIMCTALDVVEHYMDRLEKALDEQYSSSSDAVDPQAAEEAVLMLDHKLAKCFFQLNNTMTHASWVNTSTPSSRLCITCVERSVVLSARLASRFINSGVHHLSRFFGTGDYCLFERLPHSPGLAQRKFLPLFVSAIIHNNVFDFKSIGTNILELWMLAIVKPQSFLAYEIRLADTLKQHDLPYLKRAFVPTSGQAPSYDTNRAFFACAISSMRTSLREADGVRRQQLRTDFARALTLVMQHMKEDLKYMKTDPIQHDKYIDFVRTIVALIKSHGGDICPLDSFYYQQSQDYIPSQEDPQLQTAGIVAYGLRLGEGEATAAPQLFHYLHNNFNIALANNQLKQECKILERSLDNNEVFKFMLERMLPACIQATCEVQEAWPILDVYCSAFQGFLTRSCVPKDVGDENIEGTVGLLEEILAWLRSTAARSHGNGIIMDGTPMLSCEQVHTMAQLAALAHVLQPLLMTCSCLPSLVGTHTRLNQAISRFHDFAGAALDRLGERSSGNMDPLLGLLEESGCQLSGSAGLSGYADSDAMDTGVGLRDRAQVDRFCKMIVRHVRENWVVKDGRVAVRKSGARPAGSSAGQHTTSVSHGVPYGPWTMEELEDELQRQLCSWKLAPPTHGRGATGIGGSACRNRRLFPGRQR